MILFGGVHLFHDSLDYHVDHESLRNGDQRHIIPIPETTTLISRYTDLHT